MSPEALNAFLRRPLIARLATSENDKPRVLPMWFLWDGTDIWMETSDTFPNARILRQNPHAAVTIDETLGSFAFRAAVFRYLSDDEIASTEGEAILAAHHVLLRFHPSHTITWDTTLP
jgi:general stress protein 26